MSLKRVVGAGIICIALAAVAGIVVIAKPSKSANSTATNTKTDTHLLGEQTDTPSTPPAKSIKAFDSGNAIPDAAWFAQAYTAGFRLYILNTTNWGTCNPWDQVQPQIANALAAGLKVAAYTRDPNCWSNGILATGQYQNQLQFFALDIETDPGVPATQAMVDGIKALGVRPIIYTGSHMWAALEGSLSRSFSSLPLWETSPFSLSYADWQANYLSPKPVAFGGWNTAANMRIGVQQQLEYTLNGINVDLNSFNAGFLK